MSAFLHALLGVIVLIFVILLVLVMSVARDMAREDIRDRLEHIPHAILHLAACLLDRGQRVTVYKDEWLPELTYILEEDEARPVTQLFNGSRYAIGILFTARRIANRLDRPTPEQAPALPQAPKPIEWWLRRPNGEIVAVEAKLLDPKPCDPELGKKWLFGVTRDPLWRVWRVERPG